MTEDGLVGVYTVEPGRDQADSETVRVRCADQRTGVGQITPGVEPMEGEIDARDFYQVDGRGAGRMDR